MLLQFLLLWKSRLGRFFIFYYIRTSLANQKAPIISEFNVLKCDKHAKLPDGVDIIRRTS